MLLKELLQTAGKYEISGSDEIEINGIEIDSRKIKDGNAFIAIRGTQADGHDYISKAIELGAKAIICEKLPEKTIEGITYAIFSDTEDAVGKIATTFYGNPTEKLDLVGVTGTNGKTTIATLLYNMFRAFGYKYRLYAIISTVKLYRQNIQLPILSHLISCLEEWRTKVVNMLSWKSAHIL